MSVFDADGKEVMARPKASPPKPPTFTSEDLNILSADQVFDLVEKHGRGMVFTWKKITDPATNMEKWIEKKFKPPIMSTICQKLWYPVSLVDEPGISETWYYDWNAHVYRNGGKDFFGVVIKRLLGDLFAKTHLDRTFSDIKYSTPLPRNDFKVKPHYVAQKDSILEFYIDPDDHKWKIREIENTPDLYITSRYDVKYDPTAKNPLWDKFLDDVFYIKDIVFLQEYCGTFLWLIAVRKAAALVGPTNSGKTTFGFILENVLGGQDSGNVRAIPPQKLEDKYELYRVYKLPLILVNEFPRAKIEDCSILKAVITGAGVSARTLNFPSIDFKPFAKILILTNNLPPVAEDAEPFWNKWQTVTVDKQKFDDDNQARKDHYQTWVTATQEHRNAIFTWMVDGLLRYLNQGHFSNLDPWTITQEKWKAHSDSLGQFMNAENGWIQFNDRVDTPKTDLLEHYREFCKTKGISAMSRQMFFKSMMRRYLKVDNPIVRNTKPLVNGEQVECYGSIQIIRPDVEPPEDRDVDSMYIDKMRVMSIDL